MTCCQRARRRGREIWMLGMAARIGILTQASLGSLPCGGCNGCSGERDGYHVLYRQETKAAVWAVESKDLSAIKVTPL